MLNKTEIYKWRKFFAGIILPSLLTIAMFIVSIFVIIIPNFENSLMERKKEMIRELTNSAWSTIAEFEKEQQQGLITIEEAQKKSIILIQYMRYGAESKDYFWLTDIHPTMIMHPYRQDLNGKDLSDFADPHGKLLFVDFAKVVKEQGSGYVEYMWQWKDDQSKIVPKLSYVKGFKPWGWIIGTGIYIEDVREEIAKMTSRLINASIGISLIIFFLLFFITFQSMKIEKKRNQAEEELIISREKYKSLVEASTEGTAMLLEGRYIFANQVMLDMLGYTEDEFYALNMFDILPKSTDMTALEQNIFKDITNGKEIPSQTEIHFKKKDGTLIDVILSISKVIFMEKNTLIITAKDITSHKKIKEELGDSIEKYKLITNNINIGVFRTEVDDLYSFTDANPTAIRILGINDSDNLKSYGLLQLLSYKEDADSIVKNLNINGFVKNKIIRLVKNDGTSCIISLSLFIIKDDNNLVKYCDGIIEDITEQKKNEEERENLISELQTSLLFLNEPIKNSIKNMVSADMNITIKKAASVMSNNKVSAMLVSSEKEGNIIGIVTDHDIRERAITNAIDINQPLFKIMTSPVISISEHALIYEAILLMNEKSIRHLAVEDNSGKICGMIKDRELLQFHLYSPAYLAHEIKLCDSVEQIVDKRKRLPRLVKAMIDSGAKPKSINRIITITSDLILNKFINIAIEEIGEPPVPFTFVALGSEGREEQTLVTDQDNAIIYQDVPQEEENNVRDYFLKLGDKVCTWLNRAGYHFCKGDVMAKNPKWCQSFTQWQKYFTSWITASNPQDFLEFNVFFDFRDVFGEKNFADELRKHVNLLIHNKPSFLLLFAQNTLLYKPPVNIFGNIVTESSSENAGSFNIKDAMMPIVSFARIYSLKNNISETNTIERLNKLYENNFIKKSTYEDTLVAYNYLMQIRVKNQAIAINNNNKPDNFINPKELSHLEETMLKQSFGEISAILKKISFDFMGSA